MPKRIRCKHCGEDVGEFWSQLDEHLWNKHRNIIGTWIMAQGKVQSFDKTARK